MPSYACSISRCPAALAVAAGAACEIRGSLAYRSPAFLEPWSTVRADGRSITLATLAAWAVESLQLT